MSEKKEEGQKTIVSFVVGLLIGGLLVWAFTGGESAPRENNNSNNTDTEENREANNEDDEDEAEVNEGNGSETPATPNTPAPEMEVGEGEVSVNNQAAGRRAHLESATFPTAEGWVGVRDYADGETGFVLGVARYSQSQGLIPEQIILQRPTIAGKEYAIVFFTENGDRKFVSGRNTQMGGVVATFTAE